MFQYSVLLLLSVIIFLNGFFPIPNNTEKFSNDPPAHIGNISVKIEEVYRRRFEKVVLIVIDALRWDFATPELMPQAMGHMNRKGCLSKVSVESPTVTLPRIKSLTTGTVPQYIDVVKNLASSEILADSWLHSAKSKGLKTVFYGDNTWEKLFPHFFARSEGTTSFFVWDFTEVDNNVTRNVDLEVERRDWDIMILHYLGLDHIGHVLGPFSHKMPPKLLEMDGIINKIYEKTNYTDTLILVTGDHGMRDGGGHGGTSQAEITVPLITIGHNCESSSFLQTDIPANLAVLLGLNIPSTSIGKIQNKFLGNLNTVEYLYALRYNTENLLKKVNLCKDSFDNATHFHEKYLLGNNNNVSYADTALQLYQNCSEQITKELYKISSKQDMPSLFLAVLVLFNLLVLMVINLLNVGTDTSTKHSREVPLYFAINLLMQFFVLKEEILHIILFLLAILAIIKLKTLMGSLKKMPSFNSIHMLMVITCILHPLTFVSTSFIEEEHYFWIFFGVTLVVMLFLRQSSEEPSPKKFNFNMLKPLLVVLICIRFSMDLNSTIENSVQKEDNWANILLAEGNSVYHQCFFVIGLLMVYATICSDQSTASKDHNYILYLLSALSLLLIFVLKSTSHHNAFLGKLIWGSILFQKICFNNKGFTWRSFWILSSTLLIKPHNVVLIPFAVYTSKNICSLNTFRTTLAQTVVSYMLSNCFYCLQGHRNSLADVDISIGYTGLNDYYPLVVISQVLIHTYIFPVLFHLTALTRLRENNEQTLFWETLITLRTSVVLFTSVLMIVFRHHLFIWSVFAPKFFIEGVHTGFLFIEVCLWYFCNIVNRYLSTIVR